MPIKKNTAPRRETRDTTRINELIREKEVRLVDQESNHIGVVPIEEALKRAQQAGLDLVEVGAKSKPHVCRIMDYGQFRYEQSKKLKEAKKKQKVIVVKEIKLRPRIDQHDYEFKLKHAEKFLDHGDKVRFILQFRGREMAHKEIGRQVMDRVVADLVEFALVEQHPQQEGRFMSMTLAPLPSRKKKKEDAEAELAEGLDETGLDSVLNDSDLEESDLDESDLDEDLNGEDVIEITEPDDDEEPYEEKQAEKM